MKRAIITLTLLLSVISLQAQTLLIYGGSDHDVFLGKLNADCYDSESIWNEYGTYGSKYSSKSIWNASGSCRLARQFLWLSDSKRIHLPTLLLKIGRFHMPPLQANT